ncbi:hypothetical protein F2Q69_00042009 [Brassica cretica]|uniref:Retrotransposon Copia-like N-terminal domain-containing protein n=1 Tax=Brassica cretica TaxID=69181 RepID=A0A8S9NMD6_BRACR|nr:hypothetical protein F2Q69_00042009 [Brassica cretica]
MEQHQLVRIPVTLKGPNYITWSRLTRIALGGRGLWEHITTSEAPRQITQGEDGKEVVDEVSQLQTEDDASTASTNLSRFRINEIVESSVPKKKGRLVGLGRRTRSVPPSSAPPPFVDPEVLTAQLKDKDDRISLLETQMAAQ